MRFLYTVNCANAMQNNQIVLLQLSNGLPNCRVWEAFLALFNPKTSGFTQKSHLYMEI